MLKGVENNSHELDYQNSLAQTKAKALYSLMERTEPE